MKASTPLSRMKFRFRLASSFKKEQGREALKQWLKAVSGAETLTLWWIKEADRQSVPLTQEQTAALAGILTGFLAGKTARPDLQAVSRLAAERLREENPAAFVKSFQKGLSIGLSAFGKRTALQKALLSAAGETQTPQITQMINLLFPYPLPPA